MKNKKFSLAMTFILLFGIVSLFSDIVHEGANSIWGSYLSLIGASATVVGFISGFGELLGYSLRYFFGRFADKTKRYWTLTVIGYVLDTLAIPLLCLVGENGWFFASMLLIIQKIGKAIKKPAKDTIISFVASGEGVGKSFAITELLDQIGAFLGPVLLYVVMLFKTDGTTFEIYAFCFAILLIPAIITILTLIFMYLKFPRPEDFEKENDNKVDFKTNKKFIYYIIGISLFAFGFIDYSLILVHISNNFLESNSLINQTTLPLIYAFAMIIDAVAALIFGILFDKIGNISVIIASILSSLFSLFIFKASNISSLFIGITLWGIGMGAQESILKAVITKIVPKKNRATGYGIFEFSFGIFWFLGSTLLGFLYDFNINIMITISIIFEVAAIIFYVLSAKKEQKINIDVK